MKIHRLFYDRLSHGIFAVEKWKDVTSAKALEYIKEVMVRDSGKDGQTKLVAGHGGTLDSAATGVLVVGLFKGCKLLSNFLNGDKEYRFTAKLGQATTTFNSEGDITDESDYSNVTVEDLYRACQKFEGETYQVPPVYSALKFGGSRLSDLAKRGIIVTPKARLVKCYKLTITNWSPPYFSLEVKCGGGYYIRSLAHDLGKGLGTHAHVTELTRTAQSPFTLKNCLSVEVLSLHNIIEAINETRKCYGAASKNQTRFRTELTGNVTNARRCNDGSSHPPIKNKDRLIKS